MDPFGPASKTTSPRPRPEALPLPPGRFFGLVRRVSVGPCGVAAESQTVTRYWLVPTSLGLEPMIRAWPLEWTGSVYAPARTSPGSRSATRFTGCQPAWEPLSPRKSATYRAGDGMRLGAVLNSL